MFVLIRVSWDPRAGYGGEYVARSAYPEVEASSYSRDMAVHFVRGTCLMAIGAWDQVPRSVEFATVLVLRP